MNAGVAAELTQTCVLAADGAQCWGGWIPDRRTGHQVSPYGIREVVDTRGAISLRAEIGRMCAVWPDGLDRCWSTTPRAPRMSELELCHACSNSGDERCHRCRRPLCATHQRHRSGTALYVFGPFFDDGAIRCGDCYAARFWRGALAGAAIAGLVLTLLSVAKGELAGTLAGIGIGVLGVAFSLWRAAAFDRAAGL
jgi:hypothetical protein